MLASILFANLQNHLEKERILPYNTYSRRMLDGPEPIFAAICGDTLPAVLPTEKDAVLEEAFSMQTFARSHFVPTAINMR